MSGRSVTPAFASTERMPVPVWLWLGKSWSSSKWDSLFSVLLPHTAEAIQSTKPMHKCLTLLSSPTPGYFFFNGSSSPAPVSKFWLLFTVVLWAMAEVRKDLEGRACQEEETERVRKETS